MQAQAEDEAGGKPVVASVVAESAQQKGQRRGSEGGGEREAQPHAADGDVPVGDGDEKGGEQAGESPVQLATEERGQRHGDGAEERRTHFEREVVFGERRQADERRRQIKLQRLAARVAREEDGARAHKHVVNVQQLLGVIAGHLAGDGIQPVEAEDGAQQGDRQQRQPEAARKPGPGQVRAVGEGQHEVEHGAEPVPEAAGQVVPGEPLIGEQGKQHAAYGKEGAPAPAGRQRLRPFPAGRATCGQRCAGPAPHGSQEEEDGREKEGNCRQRALPGGE